MPTKLTQLLFQEMPILSIKATMHGSLMLDCSQARFTVATYN